MKATGGAMKQVLDMSVVDELLSLTDDGDPELLLDLIGMFLDDGPHKVQAVESGLADRDFEKMERAAHSLKGSSGNLGARFVQETCEQLQLATRRQDLERSRLLAPQLQQHFAEARLALENLRRKYS
jgi:HPt (histidine-containing phosphotransfer) domain-containing protein